MLLRHNKLNSEKMKKNLNEYRGEVITHLEYIKEKVDANHEHLE